MKNETSADISSEFLKELSEFQYSDHRSSYCLNQEHEELIAEGITIGIGRVIEMYGKFHERFKKL